MDMKRFFLYAIVIAALALAGCGGNGGTTTTPTDPPTTTPTPMEPDLEDLFAAAEEARSTAAAASMTAEDAVETATRDSGRLGTVAVQGDSMMAQDNAQSVLDSYDAVKMAVMDANDAEQLAEDTMNDVPATGANRDELVSALEEAMKVAEDAVESTMDRYESKALKDAVEAVKGDDPEDEDYPTTPADHARMVAMSIGGALGPTSATNGAGMRVTFNTDDTTNPRPAAPTMEGAPPTFHEANDHQGDTWAEIVGETVKMRIDTGTANQSHEVDAAKFEDMALSTAGVDRAALDLSATGARDDGAEHAGNYNGIPGTIFCVGTCSTTTGSDEVERLTGDWYFTPMSPKEWYVESEDAEGNDIYVAETLYSRYGYWVVADGNVFRIHTRALAQTDGTTEGTHYELNTVNTGATDTTLLDTKATYTGNALGISLHKEFDSQGEIVPGTLQSGQFTAKVTLDATFGTTPRLGGMIYDFEGGANVDPDWRVRLVDVTGFDGNFNDGTTAASDQDGLWTAQAYGDSATERPVGITGQFNAHFSDGHAAGAYATRKQ